MPINIVQSPPITKAPIIQPPPGAPTPEPDKEPTKAELDARRKELVETLGWDKTATGQKLLKESEAEAAAAPAPAPAAPATPAAPAPAVPPKPAAPSRAKNRASLVTQIATEVAARISPPAPAVEPSTEVAQDEFTAEDQEEIRVFQNLEVMHPEQKGITEKFKAFAKQRYQYETEWRKNNPDKEFNPEDPEHDDFYAKQPQIDEKLMEDARDDMKFTERFNRTVKPRLDQQDQAKAIEEAKPKIAERLNNHSVRLVKSFDNALAGIFVDSEGNGEFSDDRMGVLDQTDPLAKDCIDVALREAVEPMIVELEKTAIKELNYSLDGRNPVQRKIIEHLDKAERDFVQMGDEANDTQGRSFITQQQRAVKEAEIFRLPEAQRQQAMQQLRENNWWITLDQLQEIIVDEIAVEAKKVYDQLAKRTGYARPAKQPAASAAAPATPAPIQPSAATRGRPPSIASSSEVVTTGAPVKTDEQKFGETAIGVAFRR